MNIGTLTIEMAANVARLQSDMNQAKQVVSSSMDHISNAVDVAKNALSRLGIITSLGGFASLVDKTIQAAAEMHRLSQRTGVTVEALSALRGAARVSGVDMESVAAAMQKVSINMVGAQGGTGKTAEALKALGVSVQDSNGHLKSADQLTLDVAKSLDKYSAGAQKSTWVADIFGKANMGLLPVLIELAEKGNLNGKMTTEQGDRAAEFEKKIAKLKGQLEGYFKVLALDLIPVVTKLSSLFVSGAEVAVAYYAVFYAMPAIFTASTAALGSMQMMVALAKLEMAQGATFASLFAGSISGIVAPAEWAAGALGKLKLAGAGLVALFAGWEIGKWLSANFIEARLAGIAFVDGTLTAFEGLKYGVQVAWAVIKSGAFAAFDSIASFFSGIFEKIGSGLKALGSDSAAKTMLEFADKLKLASQGTLTLQEETAKLRKEYEASKTGIHAITDSMVDFEIANSKVVKSTAEGKQEAKAKAEAIQQLESDYHKLIKAINEKISLSSAEFAAVATLNEADKMRLKLQQDLADGTVRMNDSEIKAAQIKINTLDTILKSIDGKQALKKINDDLSAQAQRSIESALQEADANQKLVDTFGMSKLAIADAELARLQAQLTQRSAMALTLDEIQVLEKLIDAKKRSVAALGKLEGYEAVKKAAQDASDAWNRTAEDINQSLSKALMKGFTGTKGFITDFISQLKGMFAKLVLQPVLAPISASIASMMVPGAAQAQGSVGGALGTTSSLLSAGSTLFNGFSAAMASAGSLGTGFFGSMAGGMMGAGAGSGLTSATGLAIGESIASTVGASTASALASGMSTIAAAMPWVAAAAAAYAIGKAAFGLGERQVTGVTVQGQLGTQNINNVTGISQEGGFLVGSRPDTWTRSLATSITQTAQGGTYDDQTQATKDSDKATLKALTDGYDKLKSSTAEFAKALGISADSIKDRTDSISYAVGKDAAETQQNIAKMFADVGDKIASDLLGPLTELKKDGEGAGATLVRLSGDLTGVNMAMKALGFAAYSLSTDGVKAAEGLVDLFGGLQQLQTASSSYYDNYYSAAEKMKLSTDVVTDAFKNAGLAMPATREALRSMVDTAKAAGDDKTYAALVKLSAAFASIVPAADTATVAVSTVADAMTALASAQKAYDTAVSNAGSAMAKAGDQYQAFVDAVASAKSGINAAQSAIVDQYKAALDAESAAKKSVVDEQTKITAGYIAASDKLKAVQDKIIDGFGKLSSSLNAFLGTLDTTDIAGASASEQFAALQKQFASQTSLAKGGDVNAASGLPEIAKALLKIGKDQSGSSLEFAKIVAGVRSSIADVAGMASDKVKAAQPNGAVDDLSAAQAEQAKWAAAVAASGASYTLSSENILSGYKAAGLAQIEASRAVGYWANVAKATGSDISKTGDALSNLGDSLIKGFFDAKTAFDVAQINLTAANTIRAGLEFKQSSALENFVLSIREVNSTAAAVQDAGAILFAAASDKLLLGTDASNAAMKEAKTGMAYWSDVVTKTAQGIAASVSAMTTAAQAIASVKAANDATAAQAAVNAQVAAAYSLIGRTGVGDGAGQIDAKGLDYWKNQLNSGAVLAADFTKTFLDSAAKYSGADAAKYQGAIDTAKKLQSFDVGTNFVTEDMTAQIHAGERIMPAADNAELMTRLSSPAQNNSALISEIRALRQVVQKQQITLDEISKASTKTSVTLTRVTRGGESMVTS